jgi:hypothetical protein
VPFGAQPGDQFLFEDEAAMIGCDSYAHASSLQAAIRAVPSKMVTNS